MSRVHGFVESAEARKTDGNQPGHVFEPRATHSLAGAVTTAAVGDVTTPPPGGPWGRRLRGRTQRAKRKARAIIARRQLV